MEIWKDIKGFEGDYKVSSYGRVMSLKYGKKRILKTDKGADYPGVSLYKNKKEYSFQVHRLVALNFIKKIKGKPIVNHIDENPKNNHVDNLEWCNYSYNLRHGNGIKKMIKSRTGSNKEKKVEQLDRNGNVLREFKSVSETKFFGFNTKRVSSVCRGETITHKNYIFRYK